MYCMRLNTEWVADIPQKEYGNAIMEGIGQMLTLKNIKNPIDTLCICKIIDQDPNIWVVVFKGKKNSVEEIKFDIIYAQRCYTKGLIRMVVKKEKLDDIVKGFIRCANMLNSLVEMKMSKKVIDQLLKAEAKAEAEAEAERKE